MKTSTVGYQFLFCPASVAPFNLQVLLYTIYLWLQLTLQMNMHLVPWK